MVVPGVLHHAADAPAGTAPHVPADNRLLF